MNKPFNDESKSKEQLIKELKIHRAQLAVLEEEKTGRIKAEDETDLLKTLIIKINEAKDIHSALGIALEKVCEATGWILGQAWLPSPDKSHLVCSSGWYTKNQSLERFRRLNKEFKFKPGIGLPGRIWISKKPAWVRNVQEDTNFPRAPIAKECELRAGLGIPIISNCEVIAIMEFFMFEPKEEDARLISLISAVAAQLGNTIERKIIEEEYKDLFERFSGIYNSSKDAIDFVTLDGLLLNVNDAYVNLAGYSKEELLGKKKYQEITPVEYHEEEAKIVQRLIDTGIPQEYEKEYLRKDGTRVPISLTAFVVRGNNGKPIGLAAIIKDITERKKAEKALLELNESLEKRINERTEELIKSNQKLHFKIRAHEQAMEALKEQEANFRILFTNSPNPMLVYDLETLQILEANSSMLQRYGYTHEEILRMKITDIRPAEDVPKLLEHLKTRRDDFQYAGEWRHITKSGEIIDVEITSHTLEFNGRKASLVSAKDITFKKKAEYELRIKTDQLASIKDAMTAFIETGSWHNASSILLKSALSVTESEYGFVGVVVDGPKLRVFAHEGVKWHESENREFYEKAVQAYKDQGYLEFTNLNNLFGKVITTGKFVISNDPVKDPRSGGRPSGHPPLNSFLGVPIFKGNEVIGMIGIANRTNGYSEKELYNIELLTQAARILYENYRQQQRELALLEDKKKAEKTLIESEEKFRQIAENINEVFWMVDTTSKNIIYINNAFERIWGIPCEKLYEDPLAWLKAIHEEDREKIKLFYDNHLFHGAVFDHEYRIITPDGSIKWIHDRGFPVKNEKGELIRIVGIAKEITKRKNAENMLYNAEKKYRSLVEQIPVVTYLANCELNSGWIYISPQVHKLLGFSPEEWLKDPSIWTKQLHPEDKERAIKEYSKGLLKGDLFELQYRMLTADKRTIWVEEIAKIERDAEGKPLFIQGVLSDITEKKLAEEVRSQLSAIVEYSANGIIGTTPDGIIFSWNPGAERIYGFSSKEMIGNHISKIMPQEIKSEVPKIIEQIKTGERVEQYETVRIRKDRKQIYVSIDVAPITDSKGKITGISSTVRDITRRKEAEKQLSELQRKLSTLLNNLPGIAYRCANDQNWTMEFLNEGCYWLTGYKPEEILNNKKISYNDIIHPDDRDPVWKTVQEALSKNEPYVLEYRIITKSGEIKWLWEKGNGIFDKFGNVIALEGFTNDITERKKVDETRARLASIVESSNDAIISSTIGGIITSWNHGAEKVYGYTAAEAIGNHYSFLIPPENTNEVTNIFKKIMVGESITNYETVRIKKGGERVFVSLTMSPLKDATGNIIGKTTIARDITETLRLKAEIEKARQREQHEKEIRSLEELVNAPKKQDITVQLFGINPLKESVPGIFNNLVKRYESLVEKAIEMQDEKDKQLISEELKFMSDELCALKAGPSDLMEIQSSIMKKQNKIYEPKTRELNDKARVMILELMSYLVTHYRKQSLIPKVNGSGTKAMLR